MDGNGLEQDGVILCVGAKASQPTQIVYDTHGKRESSVAKQHSKSTKSGAV